MEGAKSAADYRGQVHLSVEVDALRRRYEGPNACEALGLGLHRVTGRIHLGSQPDPVSARLGQRLTGKLMCYGTKTGLEEICV
jgi:hypothetical protein